MRKLDPEKHAEKQAEILAAALRCFFRDGFHGASTAKICKEAGISPGHLYHYFSSKEAIATAISEAGMARIEASFGEMMKSPNVLSALTAQMDRVKTKRDANKRAMGRLVLELLVEAERNPAIAKIVQANSRKMRQLLAEFVRSGQARDQIDPGLDADITAGLLLSVLDGMRTVSIRDPKADMGRNVEYLKLMISRFLSPQ